MKLKEIVSAYKLLGEAKVLNLSEEDILSIVIARKAMRKYVLDYEEYLHDVQEKVKPENFDALVMSAQNWDNLPKEEQVDVTAQLKEFEKKVNILVKDELDKEIKLKLKPLSEECVAKLIKMNSWTINKIDEISIVL